MAGLQKELRKIVEKQETLFREEARAAMQKLLGGEASEVEIAALLTALAVRGETAAELAGFVDAMRAAAVQLPLTDDERELLVDTCGTGGDAKGTFNISTAVALVAAAAGAKIAKHGNRGVTSKCGSADVLEAMGIPVDLAPEEAVRCLRETGFLFMYAPAMHPAMKTVQPVRRSLGFRTIFNVLGPLTNPAGAKSQVMGVYAARLVPLVAETMAMLGVRHAFVVHGDGLDELSITSASEVAEIRGHTVSVKKITPQELQLEPAPLEVLAGGDATENAAILRSVFSGERGPRRDIVLLNASAALVAGGVAYDLQEGVVRAAQAIDDGAVSKLVKQLAEFGKK